MTATTAPAHWHAYAYTGHGYNDVEVYRRDCKPPPLDARGRPLPMAPPTFPPTVVREVRPSRKPVAHFEEPGQALDWLKRELEAHPPLDDHSFPVTTRLEYSRRRLQERVNRDVVYGYWSREQYVARHLIFCTGDACP